jgi:TolB-like protein/Tfp pilus assembly protein PilF
MPEDTPDLAEKSFAFPEEFRKDFGRAWPADMGRKTKLLYEFGPFRVDPQECLLWRDRAVVPLTPKLFDILLIFLQNSGRMLSKEEFHNLVWPDTAVEQGSLTRNISSLRKALGESRGERQYIETIPWRGYRFVASVKEVRDSAASPAIDSIAVLPFINLSGEPGAEYLSDGITESLINSLSQLTNLKVISRNSAFRYKGREIDAQAVGREFRVRAVLTGSILPHSEALVISVELIDVDDSSQIWGERYRRKQSDIFALQESIAHEIAENLRLRLTGAEEERLVKRHTSDAEAYQLYLRGRYHFHRLTPEDVDKGVEYFRRAIDRDRNYALAYVGLADCYNYSAKREEAMEATLRSLELDDQLAQARASLAFHRFVYDWDFRGAEREFKLALELNPNYAEAHHWYAIYLANLARHDEAKGEARRAEDLDPVSPLMCMTPGLAFFCAHDYDQALEEFRKVADLDPNFMAAHSLLGHVCEQKGMYEEAVAEYSKVMEVVEKELVTVLSLKAAIGRLEAKRGRRREARKMAVELSQSPHVGMLACVIAEIHAALGERDRTFELLNQAYENRNFNLVSLKINANFDPVRKDRRFAKLLQRIGLEPQQGT